MRLVVIKYKWLIVYGCVLALLLFLLRWLELRFLILSHAQEIYSGAIAVVFTALGIWLALKLTKPKKETIVVEKKVYLKPETAFVRNEAALKDSNLSPREIDVLELMAKGMSNAEIAEQLFVSLNTVKTHSSKLYEKLEVKRRTQAVEKARQLQLIA
ncbi:response regulator transcription factor [Flavobacterium litorale]|uniref:Response regulator transcription factor n=1 Tax=Flavobacterium litorale TaxID=2856519 RepID=A0ABX8V4V6_9FLAO|nr:response regulator transcription factor [Flavobacterium litorale]QYJ67532.1 response regulator transcription factor [Flavobacterium litorale]